MSGRGSINANNNSNKNQQQKIQKDLRDANKATRVLLTVPPHPNAARQRKELKTINAALLVAAFVVALLAFLLEYASLAWLAAFMTVAYYTSADHLDPNTFKKAVVAASVCTLAIAKVYLF